MGIKIKQLNVEDVSFQIDFEEELETVESCFDEPSQIHWVNSELALGNEAAWFCAKVTAIYKGMRGIAYLGCCSYETFEDFLKDDYLEQLKLDALDDLNNNIKLTFKDLEDLIICGDSHVI